MSPADCHAGVTVPALAPNSARVGHSRPALSDTAGLQQLAVYLRAGWSIERIAAHFKVPVLVVDHLARSARRSYAQAGKPLPAMRRPARRAAPPTPPEPILTPKPLPEVVIIAPRRRVRDAVLLRSPLARQTWAACCPHCERIEQSFQPSEETDR